MAEITVTTQNFEQEVIKSDKPVLIDFWASWCGPCSMLSPIIAQIAEEHPEIKVCKVNVDNQPELSNLFRVSSIPMLVVLKDGKVTNKTVGYQPKEDILALLK